MNSVRHIAADFPISELFHPYWELGSELLIDKYWSGEPAPPGRHCSAIVLWSDTALYVRFTAQQIEPLIVDPAPVLITKTIGLWERDVCEIFIAPGSGIPKKYYEFEVAPTGEWLDLGITITNKGRLTDWDCVSQMEAAAETGDGTVVMAVKVPFASLGTKPDKGDLWRANFFRCVGVGVERGYLAWQPTRTAQPNFHVPSKFGLLVFD